jgi:catechol 2,3-dioxygenase-like lactoylglutathione lyase family enzyme
VEGIMSSTGMRKENGARGSDVRGIDMGLEVIVIPVSDVERAKRFYVGLGWRLDAEFSSGDDFGVVQITPPHSPCSIIFGKGVTAAAPGSNKGLMLVVSDVAAARAELIGKGVKVSEVFHDEGGVFVHAGTKGRVAGPDPKGRSYCSWASFEDPDGNGWLMQEVTTRLPGRLWADTQGSGVQNDSALTALLREAEERHGAYEAKAPKHHWSGWYAAYVVARERGRTPDEAAQDASQAMDVARG